MPSVSSRPPKSNAPATSTRSLFSRIKTPFASKARNVFEFDIQLDDPHRQYAPGDPVSGTVVLKAFKPVRITHLVISLHGFAQVYKTPNTPSEGWRAHQTSLGGGTGRRSGGYLGNGFASLFEDESVLCGEGKLAEGIYHFNFEVMFPNKKLPSSIDFERGTVTYMLTATMTRPTTISPVTICDRKIYLIEDIDIAPLHEPKPRVISLEPKAGRPRARSTKKRSEPVDAASKPSESPDTSDQGRSRVSELSGSGDGEEPSSPAPSDVSFETQMSRTTGSMEESAQVSIKTGESGVRAGKLSGPLPKKSITASIELLKAGFLRGDSIPLKINVNHTKYVKSLHGIIVTLYRRATVDLHPALPVIGKDGKPADDYMPRSKTGLGGLSLSSSGSSHTYRKDLAQSFAPLIIDPRTLTAEIKVSVRVPDEAFPTISSVPGAMVSFKYFVEVVVDLQGKLAGLGRYLPNSGMLSMPSGYGENAGGVGRPDDASGTILAAWGSNFLDTSQIRRDKSVVACLFEVIVGTKDSDRKKNKGKARVENPAPEPVNESPSYENGEEYDPNYDYGMYPPDHAIQHQDHYYGAAYSYDQYGEAPPQPLAFPLPTSLEAEEANLPEKERLRRAEARLLPSVPPTEGLAESSTSAAFHGPSAPMILEEERGLLQQSPTSPPPLSPYSPTTQEFDVHPAAPSAPPMDAFLHTLNSPAAPAPAYERQASSTERQIEAGPALRADKEDARRHRLEMERSAPPEATPEESEPSQPGPSQPPASAPMSVPSVPSAPSAPSAPPIEEVIGDGPSRQSSLPRYER